MDASAWADAHCAQIRGHNGPVRCGGLTDNKEHPLVEEVWQAAREQKGQENSVWLEEPEPEPEDTMQERRNDRRDNANPDGTTHVSNRAIGASWAAATAEAPAISTSDSRKDYVGSKTQRGASSFCWNKARECCGNQCSGGPDIRVSTDRTGSHVRQHCLADPGHRQAGRTQA